MLVTHACSPQDERNWPGGNRFPEAWGTCLLSPTKTLTPTFNVLEPMVTPVCSMPSAMPSRSMFRRKGVTNVTYVAPDHFLSKFRAHVSVDPPTLSRIKSNLERKNQIKISLSISTQGSNPPSLPSPVSYRVSQWQLTEEALLGHPARGGCLDKEEEGTPTYQVSGFSPR